MREILHEASMYSNATLNDWRENCDKGAANPDKPPRLPKIDRGFVYRWRQRYGVSYRTVNFRY